MQKINLAGLRYFHNLLAQRQAFQVATLVYCMRLSKEFFSQDVLKVAPALLGMDLVRRYPDNTISRYTILETEAYRGETDLACHASKGKTKRTRIMYEPGGYVYMYLIYGMYWMLNIVTGEVDEPQAVLIRGIKGFDGPGKLTRSLALNGSFYGADLEKDDQIWVENTGISLPFTTGARIGVAYAGEEWAAKPWRFLVTGAYSK